MNFTTLLENTLMLGEFWRNVKDTSGESFHNFSGEKRSNEDA